MKVIKMIQIDLFLSVNKMKTGYEDSQEILLEVLEQRSLFQGHNSKG